MMCIEWLLLGGVCLSAKEPQGGRGILDSDAPCREGRGACRDKLEARINASSGVCLQCTGIGKCRLSGGLAKERMVRTIH